MLATLCLGALLCGSPASLGLCCPLALELFLLLAELLGEYHLLDLLSGWTLLLSLGLPAGAEAFFLAPAAEHLGIALLLLSDKPLADLPDHRACQDEDEDQNLDEIAVGHVRLSLSPMLGQDRQKRVVSDDSFEPHAVDSFERGVSQHVRWCTLCEQRAL